MNPAINNVRVVLQTLIHALNVPCLKEFLAKIASVLLVRWSILLMESVLYVIINVHIAPFLIITVTRVHRIEWFQRHSAHVLQ